MPRVSFFVWRNSLAVTDLRSDPAMVPHDEAPSTGDGKEGKLDIVSRRLARTIWQIRPCRVNGKIHEIVTFCG